MGIRMRRAHLHSRTHIMGFAAAGFVGFLALLVAALALSLSALVSSWLEDLPDYESAEAYLVAEPTTVYYTENGEDKVLAEYYLQNRRSVTMDQVSDYVIEGIVDTEDLRFYKHNGVDPTGIVRAVVAQLTGDSQGASTITQQLVRNTVLKDEQFDQTLRRKVREAYIAIQMEKMYTKDQILMMYLNTIYFGRQAYGIQAASITYFNKNASDLTLPEAALLCGLPQSPSYYDPTVNPEASVNRRNMVLERMLAAESITQEEYDEAVAAPLELDLGTFADGIGTFPYFADYVRSVLLESQELRDLGVDIMQDGLKVWTTIDPGWQTAAEAAANDQLAEIGDDRLECGLCAINPKNGYILAMVGGRSYDADQFNLATQARRQPGSSFKAYTTVAALQAGMNPTIYLNCNSPLQITPTWRVQNYGNEQYGTRTMADALALSSNTGYAQIAQAIGADKIVEAAKAMGIDVDMPAYPSITLGTVGVPPVQMAEAYATLATGGLHRDAVAITRIEDRNGRIVYEHKDEPNQAIDPAISEAAVELLKGVCRGNGTANQLAYTMQADQPVAGKTGTTEDFRDLWFCGITPQVSVAIWCGYRVEETVYVHGSYGHPYNTAVPIFAGLVNRTLVGTSREEFPTSGTTPSYKPNSDWKFSGTGAYANTPSRQVRQESQSDESAQSAPQDQQQQQQPAQPDAGGNAGGGESGGGNAGGGDSGGGGESGGDSGGGESGGDGGEST